MQAHGTAGQTYRTPNKQHGWQGTGDHSSSSSDQLNDQVPTVTPYERCPLIPCMPDLTRGIGSSVTKQQPMSELAGLHAALSSEGVQLLRSPEQQSPAQQLWSQHRQQYQQPQQQQAQSPLRSGLQQHRQHSGSKQLPSQADIMLAETPTSAQLGEVGNALYAISSRLQNMQRSKAQPQAGAPLLSGQATGRLSPAARMPAMDVSGSLDAKFPQQEVLDRLRQELATTNELVHERARRSRSPERQGVHRQGHSSGSGSASTSSKASAADQPLPQQAREGSAPASAWQLQQQELLGLAGGGSKVAADAAAALARQLANSEALRRLQPQQQQQQRQQPVSQQEVAKQGLQQVQDVTELSQMLLPGVMAQRVAVADCQQKIGALNSALQQHPHLNPAAVQGILESHRKLEQQLEVLRRENQAKELAHMNTLNVLRENTATPRDRRMAQLQHEVLVLQQQLMSKDAQMQRMQGLLAHRSQQQQGQQQHSSGELSPVAAEGQRYDEVRQVNRSLWGGLNGAGYPGEGHSSKDDSSSGSGSGTCPEGSDSGSVTPSSGSGSDSVSVGATVGLQVRPKHEQQRNLSPSKVSSLTAHFERQMAAGRTAVPQMQQQLQSLRSPNTQPGIFSGAGIRQPGDQHSLPITPSGYQQGSSHSAHTSVDNLKAQVQQQMSALDKQHQQFAGMRASLEASHKRQLETERRQREVTQERCDMLKAQNEQLVKQLQQQLQDSRAKAVMLQQQLDEQRSSGGGGSGGGSVAGDQQQQRQRLLQESAVRELQGQLVQARQEKADLQAQLEKLAAENETHEAEGKKATYRLQRAEKALLNCQDLTEQVQELKQRNRELKQQLAQAQEAQGTAEGTLQECRRQLAAAESDKAVLMDRIRQLADRASLAESNSQRSRSGDSSAGGSGVSLDLQQQQQVQVQSELSTAYAELNQQVALLRGQLVDAQSKEERLQVTNAALQERLSRLQAESAARDAGTSSRRSSSTGSQQQQQQQQVQELLQQVANLQEQLAATTTAQAAASAAIAVAGNSNNGSTHQAGEQQQQVDALQQVQQLEAILEDREIELHEWQVHADALEKDLEDLKAQLIAADGLQEQLDATQAQLTAARSQQQQLQQELEQTRGKVSELEFKLHGLNQDRNQLRTQVDALTAELAHTREGAADLRVRLDHFTGPTGPQARVKQLEQALQLAQRKLEAAEKRAAAAASQVSDLTEKLGSTQDQLVALEGHVSILEEQLAEYTQLPQ